ANLRGAYHLAAGTCHRVACLPIWKMMSRRPKVSPEHQLPERLLRLRPSHRRPRRLPLPQRLPQAVGKTAVWQEALLRFLRRFRQ
ncbi:MAG TPA: hypothetical protein VNU68_01170, partial [Verrucomicrobiae bacterium]|nr:hypothetical protein [Verrucomicrobiae bacterium]